MKTKTFLLLCLFLGIGLTQLSAQKGKNPDHTYVNKIQDASGWFPVTCDGVNFFILNCLCNLTWTFHVADGRAVWMKAAVHWTATNPDTGEDFKGRELDKTETITYDPITGDWLETVDIWRGILSGDMGSRYKITVSLTFTPESFALSFVDYKCF